MTAVVRLDDVSVAIGKTKVVNNLSFTIHPGQCWAILGRNGVGKTTLLHAMALLHPIERGSVYYAENPIKTLTNQIRARHVGVVLQSDETPFPVTVRESVIQGRFAHRRSWFGYDATDYAQADAAMNRFDLLSLADKLVNELSGGERRRVALATVFTQSPVVFLLDEPGAHLDVSHHVRFLEVLKQHTTETQSAAAIVLHDLHLAARFCDQALILLGDGNSVQGKTDDLLINDTLQSAYGYPINRIETQRGAVFVPG